MEYNIEKRIELRELRFLVYGVLLQIIKNLVNGLKLV